MAPVLLAQYASALPFPAAIDSPLFRSVIIDISTCGLLMTFIGATGMQHVCSLSRTWQNENIQRGVKLDVMAIYTDT